MLKAAIDMAHETHPGQRTVSIAPLLKEFLGHSTVDPDNIAAALALIFDDQLSTVQCASLLTLLRFSGKDRDPVVLSKCAERMRDAAAQVDRQALRTAVNKYGSREGSYEGGLCDIVGTGGDGHSTFNVSTTSSILASSLLMISKHGNRASSSSSGSADLLQSIQPKSPIIEAITSTTLPTVYRESNYAFLFAPKFHPGMRHVGPIRQGLGFRTIFNILGPLANPVEGDIEARIVGVAEPDLGQTFAEALRLSGVKKGMIVCGAENLDEISCAGKTYCWRLLEGMNDLKEESEFKESNSVSIEEFELRPSDFGVPSNPLSKVAGGKLPQENATILMNLMENKLSKDDAVLQFVLINTAALFAVSGICDADRSEMGHGDDGKVIKERGPGGLRWKEGVRRARWAIESGQALASLNKYIEATHSLGHQ